MRTTPLSLVLALSLVACGGGADDPASLADSGAASLASRDYQAAHDDFDRALELIGGDSGHAQYKRAALGSIEAQVHLDAAKASEEFLALAEKQSGVIEDKDFSLIAGQLAGERHFPEALHVMDYGIKSRPESPVLQKLRDNIVKLSKESKDPAALAALESLGYAGGD